MKRLLQASLLFLAFSSCQNVSNPSAAEKKDSSTITIDKSEVINTDVLTVEQQKLLSPEQVLDRLKQGNKDFTEDMLTIRNNTERVRKASLGQYPKAAILSCLDSRVPVEDVFHSGIGNLFVARVAGNISNQDILGSLEYACKVSGAKLIVVLGHQYCGAIKAAIDGVELGNITGLLHKIQPAVSLAAQHYDGQKTSKNADFVAAVCDSNVRLTIDNIRSHSPILKKMEETGEIKIIGAIYDMNTGKVEFDTLAKNNQRPGL
ncbi:carbonic anhydrase family protein [Pedobacter gandavensis]|uniref:carbonic anhydrase family protein n=1 Tax=Pedobacter gandavensis TaxID=2679963 RepID=UPI00292E9EEC|nr:carbonic anhydrase family protein [Pedobacter gandavensis]